jgi:thermostable 8-oxoguanine DNA glycosylase
MKKRSSPTHLSLRAARRDAFIRAIKERPWFMDAKLAVLRRNAGDELRADFVWHYMLQSLATMGNSRGWVGVIGNEKNCRKVSYASLSKLSAKQRLAMLRRTFSDAKVRWPKKKASYAVANFRWIEKHGGAEQVSRTARECCGIEAKTEYLKQLQGIGDKYARNIWMDVYHPDGYDSIAVDQQIQNLSAALGVKFKTYAAHEQYYRDIAREANVQPWALDRLVYNFTDYFLWAVQSTNQLSNSEPKDGV